MKKIDFPINKHLWNPSLIPGPVVIISTRNSENEFNIAPKSWFQMISFKPPIIMFAGGNPENLTEKNILQTKCFSVNIVDSSILQKVLDSTQWHGAERIEKSGFTLIDSCEIQAPIISECKAHLECILHDTKLVGDGLVVFGEIVHASIDEDVFNAAPAEKYSMLDQILFLEAGLYSKIGDTLF